MNKNYILLDLFIKVIYQIIEVFMKKNVLIADLSQYKHVLENNFKEAGYETIFCDSAFDAISKLKAYDIDIVVSEVELPGDNAFELYEYIQENYPYIPAIMITEKDIDTFFEKIFSQGIGNVLHKPVVKSELINLAEKLTTMKNIFGLNNYLQPINEIKEIKITRSSQIYRTVELIDKQIEDWGFLIDNKTTLNLVLHEMIINAVYHSHGYTQEKLDRIPVELKKGQFVQIQFCKNKNFYAISITDFNGKLTKKRILESINNVINQHHLIEQAIQKGQDITDLISETGRGIDLVRRLAGEYYFIIKENYRTEIIMIFSNSSSSEDTENSSLKIIEDKS